MHCEQKDTSQKSQTAAPHAQQIDEEEDEARDSLSPIRSNGRSDLDDAEILEKLSPIRSFCKVQNDELPDSPPPVSNLII